METRIFENKEAVAKGFSAYLSDLIDSKSEIHIALSGGSTPKIVFDELVAEYGDKIDWKKVHFYWGDERCVPPSDSESNFKMTQDHLLSKIEMPAGNVHRIQGENDPSQEAKRYSEVLQKQLPAENGMPRFDLVILGMGDDGHTASIFPDSIDQWEAKDLCVTVAHPVSGQIRVSLSGEIINRAETVAFLVTGKSKAEKVREVIQKEGNFDSYPASLVKPESGNLIWFLDEDAAADLR